MCQMRRAVPTKCKHTVWTFLFYRPNCHNLYCATFCAVALMNFPLYQNRLRLLLPFPITSVLFDGVRGIQDDWMGDGGLLYPLCFVFNSTGFFTLYSKCSNEELHYKEYQVIDLKVNWLWTFYLGRPPTLMAIDRKLVGRWHFNPRWFKSRTIK